MNYFDNKSTNASAESFNAKIRSLEVSSGESVILISRIRLPAPQWSA
ncbi:transposase [Sphingobacterium deserti]|nr:transposase [Sphingobacterium deserti]